MDFDPNPPKWHITESTGPAAEFHQQNPQPGAGPSDSGLPDHEIWIHHLQRPALVFGSTQRPDNWSTISSTSQEFEVCRRRSGGGVVYISGSDDVWIDLIIPQGSPLWSPDITVAFTWFGQIWLEALQSLLLAPESLQRPRLAMAEPSGQKRPSSRSFFCFADLGHGEITVDGSKVVGLSQRRTRGYIRIQSLMVARWRPDHANQALGATVPAADRSLLGQPPFDASHVVAGLPTGIVPPDRRAVVNAVVERVQSAHSG